MKINMLIIGFLLNISLSAQWTLTNFPSGGEINSVVIVDGYFFTGTISSGIYRSSDLGNSWESVNTGLNTTHISDVIYDDTISPTTIYIATDSGMFKSVDYGELWVSSNAGMSDLSLRTIYKTDNYIFAGTATKNYRSTNEGNDWEETSIGDIAQTTLAFIQYENNTFAGLIIIGGVSDTLNSIYKSTDHGITWEASDSGGTDEVTTFGKLNTRLFAGYRGTLQESTNGGNTWNKRIQGIPHGYPTPELKSFADYLFIASLIGVFTLHIDDSTTSDISDNITFPSIVSLDVNNDYIIVGVYNFPQNIYEVWTRPTSDIVTSATETVVNNLLSEYKLNQNYPNPFNPSTTRIYTIAPPNLPEGEAFVSLKVYDVLGNEVATLVNEEKPAGTYEVDFNANQFTSGVYFYKLKAGGFVQTKKMILLR